MDRAENNGTVSTGVVLLAGGTSSRLGKPKQLLPYGGKSLLQHSIEVAQASHARPIVVVLGAGAGLLREAVGGEAVQVVVNEAWEEGMSSSIRCGIDALSRLSPEADALILMVCDQPFVTSGLLNRLMAVHRETGKPIVTCRYADTVGPPALFHKSLFPQLLQLRGDRGAKGIIRQNSGEAATVLFPEGGIDIDTVADYNRLLQSNREQ